MSEILAYKDFCKERGLKENSVWSLRAYYRYKNEQKYKAFCKERGLKENSVWSLRAYYRYKNEQKHK